MVFLTVWREKRGRPTRAAGAWGGVEIEGNAGGDAKAAGQKGKIYRIKGKNEYINGYEYNYQVEYLYHEVYSDGIHIYNPRYANTPVLKVDYFRALQEINPDGFDVFTIK